MIAGRFGRSAVEQVKKEIRPNADVAERRAQHAVPLHQKSINGTHSSVGA